MLLVPTSCCCFCAVATWLQQQQQQKGSWSTICLTSEKHLQNVNRTLGARQKNWIFYKSCNMRFEQQHQGPNSNMLHFQQQQRGKKQQKKKQLNILKRKLVLKKSCSAQLKFFVACLAGGTAVVALYGCNNFYSKHSSCLLAALLPGIVWVEAVEAVETALHIFATNS